MFLKTSQLELRQVWGGMLVVTSDRQVLPINFNFRILKLYSPNHFPTI